MTTIEFYVLQFGDITHRIDMVCRLAEQAHQQQRQVYVHVANAGMVQAVSEGLWAVSADSFVPHVVLDEPISESVSVRVGHAEPSITEDDLLISLCQETPLYFSRYRQVIEIIANDEHDKIAGRERYRYYQKRGYPLKMYQVHD